MKIFYFIYWVNFAYMVQFSSNKQATTFMKLVELLLFFF